MAGNFFNAVTPTGGVNGGSGSARKTLLTVTAPTNQMVRVWSWRCSGFGSNPAVASPEAEFNFYTAGTGSGSTAATTNKTRQGGPAVQSTAAYGYTGEPTLTSTGVDRGTLHNQGSWESVINLLSPIEIAAGGMGGIAVNDGTLGINFDCSIRCEE